jgi:tetratricopeptide (TPR) repeat protein
VKNSFISWNEFTRRFGKEMRIADDVFNNMLKSGLKDNCLTKMDFTFTSDKKENLLSLSKFIKEHYPYTVEDVKEYEDIWEINGETNEIPLTKDNLMYWALDMYKRGYEFDASLDAYGGFFDPKNQKFADLNNNKANEYFDLGVNCYNEGNLSGSIFNWSLAITINPEDPNAYYSRAIVKNELYTWKAALKDYDKAIEIAPDFASALINRGALKDENGDYLGAIADYEKVIQIENAEAEDLQQAYFNLGNTRLNLKDRNSACENWKKALELGADYAQERIDKFCTNDDWGL